MISYLMENTLASSYVLCLKTNLRAFLGKFLTFISNVNEFKLFLNIAIDLNLMNLFLIFDKILLKNEKSVKNCKQTIMLSHL